MWGSSFADLAKRAQEQASSLSTGGLFDLDAMQSKATATGDGKPTNDTTTATSEGPRLPSFPLPSMVDPAVPKKAPSAPPQKGKLKVPPRNRSKLGVVKLETNSTTDTTERDKSPTREATPKPSSELERDQKDQSSDTGTKTAENEANKLPEIKSADPSKESELVAPSDSAIAEQNGSANETKAADAAIVTKEGEGTLSASDEQQPQTAASSESKREESAAVKQPLENVEPMNTGSVAPTSADAEDTPKAEPTIQGNSSDQSQQKPNPQNDALSAEKKPDQPAEPEEETSKQDVTEETAMLDCLSSPAENNINKSKVDGEGGNGEKALNDDTMEVKEEEAAKQFKTAAEAESSQSPAPATFVRADSAATEPPPAPAAIERDRPPAPNNNVDSGRVMQQFTAQIQRLEEAKELQLKELQQAHSREKEQAKAQEERAIEQFQTKIKERDNKLRELLRKKEGNELRMDSLKREVEGIKELLGQRDVDMEKIKEAGKKDKLQLEQKIKVVEAEHAKTKSELKGTKDELASSTGKLGATSDEYTTLKSRVKVVAGELKDRRAECRDLKSKIEELEESNTKLQDHILGLDSQLSDRDRSGSEKEEEVNKLRTVIDGLERKVTEGEKNVEAQGEAFEKNLAGYKKKAQNSLAVANARAAAAIQAKEEAELEARAARSTADSTMERARIAEANGQQAMVEAKEYYIEMEQAKTKAVNELNSSKDELAITKRTLEELTKKFTLLTSEKETLAAESAQGVRDTETERVKASNLQQELSVAREIAKALQDDVAELRAQRLRVESAAASNCSKEQAAPNTLPNDTPTGPSTAEDTTSKATIMMLQKQLQEANGTIVELKDALQNAVTESTGSNDGISRQAAPDTNGGKEASAPLFYAMEKQAELNTARNEINRLASLYADVQSEKVEAEESLKAVQRELDEEKAKLQRHEKLGSSGEGSAVAAGGSNQNGHQAVDKDSGRTNIEYLKNIMMSFLNAKTLAERKALVPVIGAVLCLTANEQSKAIQNIESSGGIEGFGSAFLETIGSRVGRG